MKELLLYFYHPTTTCPQLSFWVVNMHVVLPIDLAMLGRTQPNTAKPPSFVNDFHKIWLVLGDYSKSELVNQSFVSIREKTKHLSKEKTNSHNTAKTFISILNHVFYAFLRCKYTREWFCVLVNFFYYHNKKVSHEFN